jgi:mycoredoxin
MNDLASSVLASLLAVAVAVTGCGSEARQPAPSAGSLPAPASSAPESFTLAQGADGVIFRYRDPATGEVRSATTRDGVPSAARAAVVIHDPAHPAPAGADFVADLGGEPPWTAKAVVGFAFAPPPRLPEARKAGAREVVLFATSWCGYCAKARKYFQSRGIPFTELDLEKDPSAEGRLGALSRAAGIPRERLQGVPIIFIDGRAISGWDEAEVKRLLGG